MYNSNIPTEMELPSTKKLVKSTIIAAITAGVLLVTIVMPAEYGVDPTGLGKVTGLKEMGEIKMSLAQEAAQEQANKEIKSDEIVDLITSQKTLMEVAEVAEVAVVTQEAAPQIKEDTVTFTLEPNEGTEIKVALDKGKKVNYKWTSTGKINFDNHADSKELGIDYHGYSKGVGQETDEGVIEAAFDGYHGWFWRNRGKETVTVTLVTNGEYTDITGL